MPKKLCFACLGLQVSQSISRIAHNGVDEFWTDVLRARFKLQPQPAMEKILNQYPLWHKMLYQFLDCSNCCCLGSCCKSISMGQMCSFDIKLQTQNASKYADL